MVKHILVIDDEESVRDAYCLALESAGYKVEQAADGLAGLEAAKRKRPDMVFLDLKMPGIDGVETLKRLNAIDDTLRVHIVTAFVKEYMEELSKARAEGCSFEIAAKPLDSNLIRQIAAATVGTSKDNTVKFVLTLYLANHESVTDKLITNMRSALRETLPEGCWVLNVVDVLAMPEKALANDVFTTPTLVRELPEPVVKLLGNIAAMPQVMAIVTRLNHYTATLVV
ncbi:response regulator [Methylovulum psychrotolerans]|uniref:Response regulator n=1 Tax=Methylovulum psychrotolerans TaxID=1704499 RepID=A0A2S5CID8_9GAMM|nr:response regulator [Methylovulum psychrotolerans]POZ50578.1 response regulator [Methylovulum psychrotolerans]